MRPDELVVELQRGIDSGQGATLVMPRTTLLGCRGEGMNFVSETERGVWFSPEQCGRMLAKLASLSKDFSIVDFLDLGGGEDGQEA